MRNNRMKLKKVFSFILVFAMALNIITSNGALLYGLAEETQTESQTVMVSQASDFGKVETTWIEYSKENIDFRIVESGTYVMQKNVVLDYGLYVPEEADVTIIFNGKTLSRNLSTAVRYGSVIFVTGSLTLGSQDSKDGFLIGGNSSNMAGGVQVGIGGSVDGCLTNYITIKENVGYYGGGVYVSTNSQVINYGDIIENTSTYNGGGVYILKNGVFTNYGKINNNESDNYAGGVYNAGKFYNYIIQNDSDSGQINENNALGGAGGVQNWGSNTSSKAVFVNDGSINGNKAELSGGGVYNNSYVEFTNNGSIDGNETVKSGGGVYLASDSSNVFLNYGTINNNTASNSGGGIYNYKGEFINETTGTICYNTASSSSGGGVSNYSTFTNKGLINKNTASLGGGVYNSGKCKFINKGEINNNYANTNAGGVYNTGDYSDNSKVAEFENYGQINNNTAKGIAGAIFNPRNSALKLYNGTQITGNKVESDRLSGGIYSACDIEMSGKVVVSGNTVLGGNDNISVVGAKINITNALADGSKIGVNIVSGNGNNFAYLPGTVTSQYSTNINSSGLNYFSLDEVQEDFIMRLNEDSGEVVIDTHTHNWSYVYDSNTPNKLKMFCTNSQDKCECYGTNISDAQVVVTYALNASNMQYTGNAYDKSCILKGNRNVTSKNTVYYEGTGNTVYDKSDIAPIQTGTYKASVTFGNTTLYSEFAITPEMPDVTIDNVEVTYDGNYHGITVDGDLKGATIMYGTSEGIYNLNECPTYREVSDTPYTIYYQINQVGETYEGMATVSILPKEIEVIWGETDFTYDGTAKQPVGELIGVVVGDVCNLIVDGEAIEAGTNYEASASIDNRNYKLNEGNVTVTFTINKATKQKPGVYGVAETVKGKGDGKIEGLTTLMEYRRDEDNQYTVVTDIDSDFPAGIYYVRFAADDNHYESDDIEVVIDEGDIINVMLPTVQNGYIITTDKTELKWNEKANVSFELLDGYEKLEDFAIKVNGKTVIFGNDNVYVLENATEDIIITVEGVVKHEYKEPVFNWDKDYSKSNMTFACKNNPNHVEVVECEVSCEWIKAATGTQKGIIKYIAKGNFEGTEYKDEIEVISPIIDMEQLGKGSINTEVLVGEGTSNIIIGNLTTDIVKHLIDNDELNMILDGKTIVVYLEILNINKNVSDADRKVAQQFIDELVNKVMKQHSLVSKEQVDDGISFVDITLYKRIGDANPSKIADMGEDNIVITVEIPDNMKSDNQDRLYNVLRIHGDEGTVLESTYDSEKQTLTFETDRFSTYAIIYAEPNGKDIKDEITDDEDVDNDTTEDDEVEDDTTEDDEVEDDTTEDDEVVDDTTEDDEVEDDTTEDDEVVDDTTEDDEVEDNTIEDDKVEDNTTEDDTTGDNEVEDDATGDNEEKEDSDQYIPNKDDESEYMPGTGDNAVVVECMVIMIICGLAIVIMKNKKLIFKK